MLARSGRLQASGDYAYERFYYRRHGADPNAPVCGAVRLGHAPARLNVIDAKDHHERGDTP
jgi:hypothetical protein